MIQLDEIKTGFLFRVLVCFLSTFASAYVIEPETRPWPVHANAPWENVSDCRAQSGRYMIRH